MLCDRNKLRFYNIRYFGIIGHTSWFSYQTQYTRTFLAIILNALPDYGGYLKTKVKELKDSLNMDKNDYQIYNKYQRGILKNVINYYKDESQPLQAFAMFISNVKNSTLTKDLLGKIKEDFKRSVRRCKY
jgi:hypothetical protein